MKKSFAFIALVLVSGWSLAGGFFPAFTSPASGIQPNSIAWWFFNGNFSDSSGNGISLTPTGSPTFVSGDNGNQALSLDGATQFGQSTLPYSPAITISAWVNCPVFGGGGAFSAIVTKDSSGTDVIDFTILPSGKLFINVLASSSTSGYNGTGTFTLSTNTWYFVSMTYDSVNGLVGYVNGSVDNTAIPQGTIQNLSGDTFVGALQRAPSATMFQGLIEDVRIDSVALPATGTTSIAARFAAGPQ
jgi:hypothetical protein